MGCLNAYDTITQADGAPLPNDFSIPAPTIVGGEAATVTSSCRTADGTWIAWFQNDPGNNLDDGTDKSEWATLIASSVPVGVGFFPDDGSGPFIYALGVDPALSWTNVPLYANFDPCSRVFVIGPQYSDAQRGELVSWHTSVLDVQVRTDGTNVWVIVLANEDVRDPYLGDCGESLVDRCGNTHPPIQDYYESDPFAQDTGDGTGTRFWMHYGVGPNENDDAGVNNSFRWHPARVTVFAGDIGGFTNIGTVEANYHNDGDLGLISGIEACASPAEPGILHLLWSEAGMWQRLDQGYGQRVTYSRWDAAGRLSVSDLVATATVLPLTSSSEYPSDIEWCWTAEMILRNDHGSPIAFVWPWLVDGAAQPLYPGPLQVWDLSDGTLNVVQTLDPSMYPTPAEFGGHDDPVPVGALSSVFIPSRSQYASSLYADPALGGTPVYLICNRYTSPSSSYAASAFYRVVANASQPIDWLDGLRLAGYSIADGFPFAADFVSDPDNVWMPAGGSVLQLDRQCLRGWRSWFAFPVPDPADGREDGTYACPTSPPTLISDDTGDWLYGAGEGPITRLFAADPTDVAALKAKICRCCAACLGKGVRLWKTV